MDVYGGVFNDCGGKKRTRRNGMCMEVELMTVEVSREPEEMGLWMCMEV